MNKDQKITAEFLHELGFMKPEKWFDHKCNCWRVRYCLKGQISYPNEIYKYHLGDAVADLFVSPMPSEPTTCNVSNEWLESDTTDNWDVYLYSTETHYQTIHDEEDLKGLLEAFKGLLHFKPLRVHKLKIKEKYAIQIELGNKNWELRKNDRGYRVGDVLQFRVFDDNLKETPKELKDMQVTYVHKGGEYGLDKDYCILSLKEIQQPYGKIN
jgi:hypothetical protein